MSSEARWLDDPKRAPSGALELLKGGVDIEPPEGAKGAVWGALAASLGPAATGVGGASATHASGATAGTGVAAVGTKVAVGGVLTKLTAIALVAGGAALGNEVSHRREDHARHAFVAATTTSAATTTPTAVATPIAAPVPTGLVLSTAPAEEPASKATATPARGSVGGEERQSQLREESALVIRARDAVRQGRANEAIGLLDSARGRFSDGVLAQEREALSVEALSGSGRATEAQSRAKAFLAAYPKSPHAARMKSFASR